MWYNKSKVKQITKLECLDLEKTNLLALTLERRR